MTQRSVDNKVCQGQESRNQASVTMFGLCPESWSPSSLEVSQPSGSLQFCHQSAAGQCSAHPWLVLA